MRQICNFFHPLVWSREPTPTRQKAKLSCMSALTALEKAKAIAAKLNSGDDVAVEGGNSSDVIDGMKKRNRTESADDERPSKLPREESGGGDSSVPGSTSQLSMYGNGGGDTEESISVPNAVIGYVIGRGGESIKNIQSVTGCNVQIQREQDMPPGSNVRTVTFKSPEPSTVAMAKAMVEKMVKDRLAAVSGGNPSSSGGGGGGWRKGSGPRLTLGIAPSR